MFRPKPTLAILQITHPSKGHDYQIISIAGLPFYQSSGNQSNHPNTWFPFFGLENAQLSYFPIGAFIKAMDTQLPKDSQFPQLVYEKIRALYPSYSSHAPGGRELLTRFWNVPCLLLSSSLGGGLWDGSRGKELKAFLEKEFPDYYQQVPTLEVMPSNQTIYSHLNVNEWLCRQANLDDYLKLKKSFPRTLPLLMEQLAAPFRSPSYQSLFSLRGVMYGAGFGILMGLAGASTLLCTLIGFGCYGAVLVLERRHNKQTTTQNTRVTARTVRTDNQAVTVEKVAKTAKSVTWLPSVKETAPVKKASSKAPPSHPRKGILKK